jgi:hypothetical protein
MGKERNTYRVLVRKPEGNRPHGRPGHTVLPRGVNPIAVDKYINRQKDNVIPCVKATGREGTGCIYLTQDRKRRKPVVNMVMNICVLLMHGTSCPVFSWKLKKTVKVPSYIQAEQYIQLNVIIVHLPTQPMKYNAWFGFPPITPSDCLNVKQVCK